MARKASTTKTAPQVANPQFDLLIEKLRKAAGWTIIDNQALSQTGTTVKLNQKGQVIIANLSAKLEQTVSEKADVKTIALAVIDIDKKSITALQNMKDETKKAENAKKQEEKKMATKKDDTNKNSTAPATPLPPAKKIGAALVNPAGDKTPVYDLLKKNAETDTVAREKITAMWEKFGETYSFSVSNLTKALLAEGLWPASKDKDGDFKADEAGNQIPVGYQKVYKEEKEQGIKGIGHLVNVAAASFGRHNMAAAAKNPPATPASNGGMTPVPATPDEKAVAKRLNQIEKLALGIPEKDLVEFLQHSKAFAPAMAKLKETADALAGL